MTTPTAFEIHSLAGHPGLLPLSFETEPGRDGIGVSSLCALGAAELAELLADIGAESRLCLFGVGHITFAAPGVLRRLSVAEIAQRASVSALTLDADTIVIAPRDLPTILDGFHHYDLQVLDLPKSPALEEAATLAVLTALETNWANGDRVLERVPGASIHVDIHDDCYVRFESRRAGEARRLLALLLRQFVGAATRRVVAGPSIRFAERVLEESRALAVTSDAVSIDSDAIRLGATRRSFRFGSGERDPVEFVIEHRFSTGEWTLGRA